MWVEVLLFLVAAATAAYLYITRNVGWFKARGVCEHDYSFPCGTPEFVQAMQGKLGFGELSSVIYEK